MPNIIRHFASNANIRGDFSSTYTKPPFRALHPPRHHQTPAMRASFPIIPRPHCGRCFPSRNMSHLPAADVNSPSPNIPHLPAADVYSPSPFMEMGVADRPGVRSTHAIIPRQHCGRLCLIGQSLTRYHHDVFVIDGASRNHLIRRSLEFIPADDYFWDRVIGFPLEFTCIESVTSQFEQYVHRELIVAYRQKTKN